MTECSLQLEVCGATQAAPISTGVEKDGNAWNLSSAMRRTNPSCGKSKEIKMEMQIQASPFYLASLTGSLSTTLQNTTSNLASAIKRTIKRLPRPPQMFPHIITAWIKHETTSKAAANSGKDKCCPPSLPLLKRCFHLGLNVVSAPGAPTSFTSQSLRFGSRKLSEREKISESDGWRMINVLECVVRELGANPTSQFSKNLLWFL